MGSFVEQPPGERIAVVEEEQISVNRQQRTDSGEQREVNRQRQSDNGE